mmetsp:Transcript_1964/g.3022  ORF Transcript_1964/g.3022 Transcript_1964/m.3022 type:complete len:95 (+) Transcript_1964:511-795(+)
MLTKPSHYVIRNLVEEFLYLSKNAIKEHRCSSNLLGNSPWQIKITLAFELLYNSSISISNCFSEKSGIKDGYLSHTSEIVLRPSSSQTFGNDSM